MSQRTVLLAVALAAGLGACGQNPNQAWKGPGWYLEVPYLLNPVTPVVYAGPYTYDACEADRSTRPHPERYVCVNQTKQPEKTSAS